MQNSGDRIPKPSDSNVIYRDIKTGKKINVHNELQRGETSLPTTPKWGRGLKQEQDKESRFIQLKELKDQPFARNKDNIVLNRQLKSEVRWDDPMREHLGQHDSLKRIIDSELATESDNVKRSCPAMGTVKSSVSVKSIHRGPPNRYDIPPGQQWDGVNRSNGFEAKLMSHRSDALTMKKEAYMWSTEDM